MLRKWLLHEGDVIVTLLTRDHGKVDCIAKSARRLTSRFCGRLELFNRVTVELFSGRTLESINEAETVSIASDFGGELTRGSIAFFVAELTHRLLPPGQLVEGVYSRLDETLSLLRHSRGAAGVMLGYAVQFLGLLGFMPSWRVCARCARPLDLAQPIHSIDDGLALGCAPCIGMDVMNHVPTNTVKIVHFLQTHSLPDARTLDLTRDQEALWMWLKGVLRALIPSEIKSAFFAERILLKSRCTSFRGHSSVG